MSLYLEIETQFCNVEALLYALAQCGYPVNHVDIHKDLHVLHGYKGDARKEKAHIIIEKGHIDGYANDVGFVINPDGSITAIISEYDRGEGVYGCGKSKWNAEFTNKLLQHHNHYLTKKHFESKGWKVKSQWNKAGEIVMEVEQ